MRENHGELVERDEDLDEIERSLDGLDRGRGSLLWFEGSAGLGKTAVLTSAVDRARRRGMSVASAVGHPLEQDYSFGVVLQLFEPLLAGVDSARQDVVFAGAAGAARALLVPDGAPDRPKTDLFGLVHALYWAAANLAADRPLVLVVDDAHWADRPSLRFLDYLSGRLAALPLAVICSSRVGADARSPELSALLRRRGGTIRRLRALSERGVNQIVGDDLGEEDRGVMHRLTAGNPLLAWELAENLSSLRAADPEGGSGLAAVLPGVLRRFRRLDDDAQALARACAIAGDGSSLTIVMNAAGLAGRPSNAVSALLDAVILTDADPIRFVHPLVQASLAESLDRDERANLHQRIAILLDESGAPAEIVASHLLRTNPGGSSRNVEVLRRAAQRAVVAGSAKDAVQWLLRALAERTGPDGRVELLLDLAHAEAAAASPGWRTRLADAVGAVEHPELVAHQLLLLSSGLQNLGALEAAAEFAWQGLELTSATTSGLRDGLLAVYATSAPLDLDERSSSRERLAVARDGWTPGPNLAGRVVRAHDAYEQAIMGGIPDGPTVDEVAALARRAIDPLADANDGAHGVPHQALIVLQWCDQLTAVEPLVGVTRRSRARSDLLAVAKSSIQRARINLARCRPADAVSEGEVACNAARLEWRRALTAASADLALARLELDDPSAADRALELSMDDSAWWHRSVSYGSWLFATGAVRLAQDRVADALDALAECGRHQDRMGIVNPMVVPWRGLAAVAHARIGEQERARELADTELVLAERFGAPRAIAAAMRVAALIGPRTERIERLRTAVAVAERAESTIELARCQLELGSTLRRRGERAEARDALRKVLDRAERGGALLLARRARDELRSAGAKPRRSMTTGLAALTSREHRVVALVAMGRRNREIAEELFVSVKTVEFHIANAFGKLGISRRDDLAAVITANGSTTIEAEAAEAAS